MSDLISRQEAIDALMPIYKTASTRNRNVFSVARKCLETIENLPSAEPKKGKWIVDGIETQTIDAVKAMFQVGICSECGGVSARATNFCPICGAKMEE